MTKPIDIVEYAHVLKQASDPVNPLVDSIQVYMDSNNDLVANIHDEKDPGTVEKFQLVDFDGFVTIPVGNQAIDFKLSHFFKSTPDQPATWTTTFTRQDWMILLHVDNSAGQTITFGSGFTDVDAISATGIVNKLLYSDGVTVREIALGGGGGTPGGANTQVQFNDSGSFGGDAGFVYNKTTDVVTIVGRVDIPEIRAKDANGLQLREASGTYGIKVTNDGQLEITLGDASGAKELIIKDSAGDTRATLDSDGNLKVYGTISFDEIYDNGNSGASKTIDWTVGNKQMITTTGNCELTFTAPPSPCCLQLIIIHENSVTSYAYTFPATLYFFTDYEFVATPNVANAVDILSIIYTGIVGKEYVGYGMTNA